MDDQGALFDAAPDAAATRRCTKCGVTKPLATSFSLDSRGLNGVRRQCKACDALGEAARVAADPDHYFKRNLWVAYRLRMPDYEAILASQLGRCAICMEALDDHRHGRTHVDHDHACDHPGKGRVCCPGCVRGVLCASCNIMVGWVEKRRAMLGPILRYLGTAGESILGQVVDYLHPADEGREVI